MQTKLQYVRGALNAGLQNRKQKTRSGAGMDWLQNALSEEDEHLACINGLHLDSDNSSYALYSLQLFRIYHRNAYIYPFKHKLIENYIKWAKKLLILVLEHGVGHISVIYSQHK